VSERCRGCGYLSARCACTPRAGPSATTPAPSPPLSVFLRPELPEAALYGLPGRVVRALAEITEADPAAMLLNFLTMFGNAAGPEPHTRFGVAEHSGRLFTVVAGPPGEKGRKGTAYEAVEPLFKEADPDWADNRVVTGLQSAETMIDRVADGESDDCRLMIVETEFSRLMATMARTGTLSAHLRNAYDGKRLQRARSDRSKSQTASHHHISMIGMITPEELLQQYTRLKSAGGLESRILFCYSAPPASEVSPFTPTAALPENLTEQVRQALLGSRAAVMEWADPISRHLLELRGIQPSIEVPFSAGVRDGWNLLRKQMPTVDRELGNFLRAGFDPGDPARCRLRRHRPGTRSRHGAHRGSYGDVDLLRAVGGGHLRHTSRRACPRGKPASPGQDRPVPAHALPRLGVARRHRYRPVQGQRPGRRD
jgi:hypothetical protein